MLVKHPRPFQTFPKPCFHLDPTTGVFYIGTIMTIQIKLPNLICIRNQVDYPDTICFWAQNPTFLESSILRY